MKSPMIVAFSALVVSVAALANTLMNSSSSQARAQPAHLPSAVTPDADLLARVNALAEADRKLRDELAMLALRPASSSRAPVTTSFASEEQLETLRDELLAALEGQNVKGALVAGDSPSPEFTERVHKSMAEIRVTEAIDNAAKQVASRSARLKKSMPEAAQKLGLTSQQESALEASLTAHYEKRANYGVLWATGEVETRADFGEIAKSDLDAFLAELGGFLTPQQLELYLSLQGNAFPGGPGGDGVR